MAPESFTPGVQVVHTKMKIIGIVVKVEADFIHVNIAENKPIQVWKRDELAFWDQRSEIQKRLKQGGYIRSIFKKPD